MKKREFLLSAPINHNKVKAMDELCKKYKDKLEDGKWEHPNKEHDLHIREFIENVYKIQEIPFNSK